MSGSASFSGSDLQTEVRDPDRGPLVRLFKYSGSAFDEPAPEYRNGRFDPPQGHKGMFSVLYTADNIAAAAMECRVLCVDQDDTYSFRHKKIAPYRVVRFEYNEPALFIRVDGELRAKLGIPRFAPDYAPYQRAAMLLFERYGRTYHGLSWDSFHRGQPGRDYGFWHHQKAAIGLRVLAQEADCLPLAEDPEWLQLLRDHPSIELRPDDDPVSPPAAAPGPAARSTPKSQ